MVFRQTHNDNIVFGTLFSATIKISIHFVTVQFKLSLTVMIRIIKLLFIIFSIDPLNLNIERFNALYDFEKFPSESKYLFCHDYAFFNYHTQSRVLKLRHDLFAREPFKL